MPRVWRFVPTQPPPGRLDIDRRRSASRPPTNRAATSGNSGSVGSYLRAGATMTAPALFLGIMCVGLVVYALASAWALLHPPICHNNRLLVDDRSGVPLLPCPCAWKH